MALWRGRDGDGASKTPPLLPATELRPPLESPLSEAEEEEDMKRVFLGTMEGEGEGAAEKEWWGREETKYKKCR